MQDELRAGEDIAHCPSCTLFITVIYDPVSVFSLAFDRTCLPLSLSVPRALGDRPYQRLRSPALSFVHLRAGRLPGQGGSERGWPCFSDSSCCRCIKRRLLSSRTQRSRPRRCGPSHPSLGPSRIQDFRHTKNSHCLCFWAPGVT